MASKVKTFTFYFSDGKGKFTFDQKGSTQEIAERKFKGCFIKSYQERISIYRVEVKEA